MSPFVSVNGLGRRRLGFRPVPSVLAFLVAVLLFWVGCERAWLQDIVLILWMCHSTFIVSINDFAPDDNEKRTRRSQYEYLATLSTANACIHHMLSYYEGEEDVPSYFFLKPAVILAFRSLIALLDAGDWQAILFLYAIFRVRYLNFLWRFYRNARFAYVFTRPFWSNVLGFEEEAAAITLSMATLYITYYNGKEPAEPQPSVQSPPHRHSSGPDPQQSFTGNEAAGLWPGLQMTSAQISAGDIAISIIAGGLIIGLVLMFLKMGEDLFGWLGKNARRSHTSKINRQRETLQPQRASPDELRRDNCEMQTITKSAKRRARKRETKKKKNKQDSDLVLESNDVLPTVAEGTNDNEVVGGINGQEVASVEQVETEKENADDKAVASPLSTFAAPDASTAKPPFSKKSVIENTTGDGASLISFLCDNSICIKGSPYDFCQWLQDSEDIHCISDLSDAVQEKEYLRVLQAGDGTVGLKGFKRVEFKKALMLLPGIIERCASKDGADETNIPPELVCPISHALMVDDPVLASDNYTYERSSIEAWFRRQTKEVEEARQDLIAHSNNRSAKAIVDRGVTSPTTGEKLVDLKLSSNAVVRTMARDFANFADKNK